jgi:Tol biopolymer transport system component/pimeloyl-ACP methyl ester carboxylesterase
MSRKAATKSEARKAFTSTVRVIIFATILASACGIGCRNSDIKTAHDANITPFQIPPVPDSLRQSMSRYQNWRSASLADFGPAGRGMVILTRFCQTSQIHFVSSPLAFRRQLTFFSEPVIRAFVCPAPDKRAVLFTQDSGGDENFQIYYMDLDSLRPMRLTEPGSQNDGVVWSNAGDRFVFQSNKRNKTDFDLYISNIRRPSAAAVALAREGTWSCLEFSPDDSLLLVSRYISRTASFLFFLDLKKGWLTPLHDTTDTVSQELGAWGQGGKGIFLTSDEHTDFRTLRYFDRATKKETILTPDIRWDVREIVLSKDKKLLAFTTNENGLSSVYLMNTATFKYSKIPGLPQGIIGGLRFHPSGRYLGMTITTPQQPEDAYTVSIPGFSLERWTESELGGLDTGELAAPRLMHYPTFDSVGGTPRLIPCFLYKPIKGQRPRPFPVLITIHGGPESQYWPYFSPETQFFVNELGCCVLAPNVRGSGGYGKEYLSLDNGYRREDAVKDIGRLLDWIATQPDLDAGRVCIRGGSYGGYMALASMVRYNDRLKAGIDLYGIANFLTFLQHTASYRRDLRRVEYGDERDPSMAEFLRKISPLTNASRIGKPLLIIQGANDARVPLEESQQIAAAVRKNNGIVWMLVAGDEGHGYRRKSNQDYQDLCEALFLKTFLR